MDFKTRQVFPEHQCRTTSSHLNREVLSGNATDRHIDPSASRRPYMLPVFGHLVPPHLILYYFSFHLVLLSCLLCTFIEKNKVNILLKSLSFLNMQYTILGEGKV